MAETESLLALENEGRKRVHSNLLVNDVKVRFLLDGGISANILPRSIAPGCAKVKTCVPTPHRSTLRMFDTTELATIGMVTATLKHPRTGKQLEVDFYVGLTEREKPILGIDACCRLDLLRIMEEQHGIRPV